MVKCFEYLMKIQGFIGKHNQQQAGIRAFEFMLIFSSFYFCSRIVDRYCKKTYLSMCFKISLVVKGVCWVGKDCTFCEEIFSATIPLC